MASGQFEEAAQLVRTPTRFYKDVDGYWVMASPVVDPKTELTIRAVPDVWIARFVNGKLKATTTSYCAAEEDERSCYYLQTNIMCDPLQMFVLLVPDSDRVMLVVEPIGDRADFTLE